MHQINHANYEAAGDAVRDILMMYVDLVSQTAGFGHAANVFIRFDPLMYVDAEVAEDGNYYVDIDLLRAGSAVAILCDFYDLWIEGHSFVGNPRSKLVELAIVEGRLAHFPDIEAVLREVILRREMSLDDPWFDAAVAPIYRNRVLSFFARLAASDDQVR